MFDLGDGKVQIRRGDEVFLAVHGPDAALPDGSWIMPAAVARTLQRRGLCEPTAGEVTGCDGEPHPPAVTLVGAGALRQAAEAIVRLAGLGPDVAPGPASRPLPPGARLVLACFDSPRPSLFRQVNRWALAAAVPWLPLYVDTTGPVVGPFTVPGDAACWECSALRRSAATSRVAELHAYWSFLDTQPEDYAVPSTATTAERALAAALAAADCAALLANGAPRTKGNVIEAVPGDSAFQAHPVLPVPSCPACGDGTRAYPDTRRTAGAASAD